MVEVAKGTLKARLLEFLRTLEDTGEPIIITSYGKPVAQITRLTTGGSVDAAFADLRGQLRFTGDPDADTSSEWRDR
jgi:prevent-host-death family protein